MAEQSSLWKRAGGCLSQVSDALVSVFFPGDCRICEKILEQSSRVPICGECLRSFQRIPVESCNICGQPLPKFAESDSSAAVCPVCRQQTYAFEQARSYALYEEALVKAILLLKFERIEPLGVWFANRLAEMLRENDEVLDIDVVVPVPLHRHREKERGYNQADLIAKPLAKRLSIPYKSALLVRTKPRPEKRLLSTKERWESVRGAFATRPGSQVDNRRVLLVDDVMTTGATLDACARALRDGGARSVIGLTIARAARNPTRIPASRNPRDAR